MCSSKETIGFQMGDTVNILQYPPDFYIPPFPFYPPDDSIEPNLQNVCTEKSEPGSDNGDIESTYCQMLGFVTCPFNVNEQQLLPHLTADHFVEGTVGNELIVEQSLLQERSTGSIMYRPHFLEAFETSFFLISGYDKFQGLFFWNIQRIQSETESTKFRVKIELLSAHTVKNNVIWEAPVGSLRNRKDYDSFSCLIVREESMSEFQFSEVEQRKYVFCGGDANAGIDIPGWRVRVTVTQCYPSSEHEGLGDEDTESIKTVKICMPETVRSTICPEGSSRFPARHYGVNCNGCGWENIQGMVFSCVECIDFNICMFCLKVGCHNNHIMICTMRPDLRCDVKQVLNDIHCNRFVDLSIQG